MYGANMHCTHSKRFEGVSARSSATLVPEKCWYSYKNFRRLHVDTPYIYLARNKKLNCIQFLTRASVEHVQTHGTVFLLLHG